MTLFSHNAATAVITSTKNMGISDHDCDIVVAVTDRRCSHNDTLDNDSDVHEVCVHHEFGGISETTEHDSSLMCDDSNSDGCRTFLHEVTKEMMAEMSGTFVIVQLGTGAVMSSIYRQPSGGGLSDDLLSIASIWMIAVTLAISISVSISSAHLNPAITLAFVIVRPKSSIGWYKVVPYILAQFTGAMFGSSVNLFIYYEAIKQYEMTNGIIRSSANAMPSAIAFGESFRPPSFGHFLSKYLEHLFWPRLFLR